MELFCALYEERSVSKAAAINQISQPSASRILKELREELDDELFISVNNQLQPTEYTEVLYPHLREILEKMNEASKVRKNLEAVYKKLRINIAGMAYFLQVVCPRLIDSVSEYIDDIFINMSAISPEISPKSSLENDLRLGRLDFVVHEHPNIGDNLTKKTIITDEWKIILPKDITKDELSFIRIGRSEVDSLFENSETCGLTFDFQTIIELVKASVGYSVVPSRLISNIPEIKAEPIDLPPYKLYLYWRPDRSKDQRLHLFRKAIVKECASLPKSIF